MIKSTIRKRTFKAIYRLLNRVSPLDDDCGKLCGAACCTREDGRELGMYLLPGEDKVHDKKDGWLKWSRERAEDYEFPESWKGVVNFVRCAGPDSCKREIRPMQCRTFPLAPHITEDGELMLVYNDMDLPYRCPLIEEEIPLEENFVQATYTVWQHLIADPLIYDMVRMDSELRERAIEELQEMFGMKKDGPIISVAEMRAADAYTIEKGTPSKELMFRAARGVYDAYGDGWKDRRTVIVCGSGNNAGDGYALAGIMKDDGHDVTVISLSDKFSEDGAFYFEKCREKQVPISAYGVFVQSQGTEALTFEGFDVVVDCILGTGFAGIPREPAASAIEAINRAGAKGAFVISVDINSGMNGDTGEGELAVKSDLTVSIGYYKKGFFRGRAPELVADLTNVDIGIELP